MTVLLGSEKQTSESCCGRQGEETSRFSQAAQTLRKALALLSESREPERHRALQQRLRTYEEGKP